MKKQSSQPISHFIVILIMAAVLIVAIRLPSLAADTVRLQKTFKAMGGPQQRLTDWQTMLHDANELPVDQKLKRVNEFFNRNLAFFENREVWGVDDYWATPLESLTKGKGDCKGYVIAKYYSLLELQVPARQLRLIYVRAQIGGADSVLKVAHMVLAYYPTPESEPLVLDNLITDIRPASRRPDLLPIFSFNGEGVFVGVGGDAKMGPGGVGQLSHWADLLRRAHAEGF